jgi:GNAT superfamily N-acetyltransferase
VRRELPDGYELDDDAGRLDLVEVHRVLSTECYWARGRPFEVVERTAREAARVVGLYHGGRQVGYARVVSDGLSVTYLADVYVEADHRGRGLGLELVREAVDNGPQRALRWSLHTEDMQGLYARLGFGSPDARAMERPPR